MVGITYMCTCMSDNSSDLGRILAVVCGESGDAFTPMFIASSVRVMP